MHPHRARLLAAGAAVVLPLAVAAQRPAPVDASRTAADRVARLSGEIAKGTQTLARDGSMGYLRPLLDALGVSVESQLLVFSKTGVQRAYTGPSRPRALYFNESVVVGYNPGAPVLEIAAHDPLQGVIFYTLDQQSPSPSFTRQASCLACHVSPGTLGVPGLIARSHMVDGEGTPMPKLPVTTVNHQTPHTQRWGGWFVTANAAAPRYAPLGHLGNVTLTDHPRSGPSISSDHVFVEWMNGDPGSLGYPSALSDLAALMTFDHQAHAINLLTRLNRESRAAEAGTIAPPLRSLVNELADYFLFVGEAPLAVTVTPRPGFAAHLASRTPEDRQGRSLAEFDLSSRLMRYPCSYMIYSEAFDALPAPVKAAVYERLSAILSGGNSHERYRHLSPDSRRAILDILRDTKGDFREPQ